MNKSRLDFIEIGSYDEEELAKLGSLPFRNVSVELDALQCLRFFPCVENLILRPGEISEEGLGYLRGLRIISLKLDYYSDCIDLYAIDLAQFPDLQFLFSRTQYNFYNIAMCQSLCTLVVQEWLGNDLTYLVGSSLRAYVYLMGNYNALREYRRYLRSYHSRLRTNVDCRMFITLIYVVVWKALLLKGATVFMFHKFHRYQTCVI